MPVRINSMPDFTPGEISFAPIPLFQYDGDVKTEVRKRRLSKKRCLRMLEGMMMIRAFEEMIYLLRLGGYEPLAGFEYRGPTHLSIGQEAVSVGACSAIGLEDYITSTHRGHGDGIAKGFWAIFDKSDEELRESLGADAEGLDGREALEDAARELHMMRTAAELFGKEAGYCKGRGGGMHIADFTVNHLGANAIVGGSVPIATGAGYAARYRGDGRAVLCFAGDGAYNNGVVLESLNMATMAQFTNDLAQKRFGVPVIYLIVNNQYGMTGQIRGEVSGVEHLARRAAGYNKDNMRAEVVNGMDALAVWDAVRRARALCRKGRGPVLIEAACYRFYGHSLSDPRNEYRSKDEEAAWKALDPVAVFQRGLVETGVAGADEVEALRRRVQACQDRAAVRAAEAADPAPEDAVKYMYSAGDSSSVPAEARKERCVRAPRITERQNGAISMKEAIREAMCEEMMRDNRVIFYGEDVADYGGAFKLSKGMLEWFGRDRIFNAAISEAAIVGTAVGAAMAGLRPIVELMYSDFEFMAGDQLNNQAAKWSFMSGGMACVPMVLRTSTGAGKGYGGQHSQALESHSTHTPGLRVVVPSTPYDAKGLLKTAVRDNNPVVFVESQSLYNDTGEVPEQEYLIPFGEAVVRREGADVTIIAWGLLARESLRAAEMLDGEGISAEVIDPRTLNPFDYDTVVESVRKTGRAVVVSQACRTGSFTGEVASQIQERAFDYLDAPALRVGAKDAVSPQSEILERAYLPFAEDVVAAVRSIM